MTEWHKEKIELRYCDVNGDWHTATTESFDMNIDQVLCWLENQGMTAIGFIGGKANDK